MFRRFVLVLLLVVGAGLGVLLFSFSQSSSSFSARVVNPFPVARVAGEYISLEEYNDRSEYMSSSEALGDLIREEIMQSLLTDYSVSVSIDDVEQEFVRIQYLAGGKESFLEEFRLTEEQYINVFVRPSVKRIALERAFLAHLPSEIDGVHQKQYDAARLFQSELQLESSSEEKSNELSELGWKEVQLLDPWFFEALHDAESGFVSEPVRSSLGWHVFRVEDVRSGAIGREVYLSERLFEVPELFSVWLESRILDVSVDIFLPGFQWEQGRVVRQ